jgi:uncharacterized protein YndB with AHSA1/START domain
MKTIRKEMTYPHPPHRVWRALVDPKILATWLMESDIEPRVGHRFQFRTRPGPGFDGIVHCEIIEADPPRRLAYTWGGGPTKNRPTLVEWTLTPVAGGTHLVLEHSGFEGVAGLLLRTMLGRGWGHKLTQPRHLLTVLNQVEAAGDGPADVVVEACARVYAR